MLTDQQVAQIDNLQSIAFEAMEKLIGEDIEWDMEWVGVISDVLCKIACEYFGKNEMEIYPYIENEEE